MKRPRGAHQLVTHSGKFYAIGGFSEFHIIHYDFIDGPYNAGWSSGYDETIEEYDPPIGQWNLGWPIGASLPEARKDFVAVAL